VYVCGVGDLRATASTHRLGSRVPHMVHLCGMTNDMYYIDRPGARMMNAR